MSTLGVWATSASTRGRNPIERDCSTISRRTSRSASSSVVAKRVVGHRLSEHLPDLPHDVDRLVEGEHEIAFTQLDLFQYARHRGAVAPCAHGAIESFTMTRRDEQSVAALGREDFLLQVVESPS